MTDIVLKRGRGRPSFKELEERKKAEEAKKPKPRTSEEMLTDLTKRFNMLARLTKGAINKDIRSLVVAGAPGVGKTYTVEKLLEENETPSNVVRGTLSAIALYKQAYKHRHAGNVLVLDDADGIFNDEDALNILKALCDTSETRKVSYLKEAKELVDEEGPIPQQFEFNGAMIFISNLDFQQFVDDGKNKYAAHFEALMSRSLYLDLRLQSRKEIAVWVEHITVSNRLFDKENVPKHLHDEVLQFIRENADTMRDLSIRTVKKLAGLVKSNPTGWKDDAQILMTRGY